ncbi:PTS sugar transporter subunit IIA [uncultured Litoreibacter sp.]|uniref:PTS sugar transporter subunit IIA n=1 Tax=uncultured Litoreibacter sp. TaxID=1392394 RepID=UPI002627D0D4|nr:PTS sugar transporter subunit IIA [uncultured Litoreibacter sp.]
MQIVDILQPSSVRSVASISSKKRLFQELADLAESSHGLPASEVFDALQDRESLGPTGVGQGVALPHARLDSLDTVVAVFLRLDKAVDFDSADRQPVDLFFCLLAPPDAGVEHLKALALVSRTMRVSQVCAKLRANDDASTLFTILTDSEGSQAA